MDKGPSVTLILVFLIDSETLYLSRPPRKKNKNSESSLAVLQSHPETFTSGIKEASRKKEQTYQKT